MPPAEQACRTPFKATSDEIRLMSPRLWSMARHYALRSKMEPEDLYQEACLGVLLGLEDLDPTIGSARQYLLKRARWRILDVVKKEVPKRNISNEDSEKVDEVFIQEDDCEGRFRNDEFLERLSRMQRNIVIHLMEGCTWQETGRRLGCSSPNVAYHVRDIRRRLQDWMGLDF